jgi:ribonuclease HI
MKYEIYTDGATSGNGYEGAQGGWAWLILNESEDIIQKGKGHIDNATNNICELAAVIEACTYAWRNINPFDRNPTFIIYSDSAYIINCYKQRWYKKWQTNGWINSKKQPVANKDYWKLLIPYFEDSRFFFEKVEGHADNIYNNLVDEMAVEAKFMRG